MEPQEGEVRHPSTNLGLVLSKCQEELVLNRFSRWEAGTELQERLVGTVQKM